MTDFSDYSELVGLVDNLAEATASCAMERVVSITRCFMTC